MLMVWALIGNNMNSNHEKIMLNRQMNSFHEKSL
jgi:hypothetical protein